MSLLARARLSAGRSLFPLYKSNFYSTKSTPVSPKTQLSTNNAGTQNPSQSSTLSDKITNQTGPMIDWPKPVEIPYQAKVANSVNLIGRVKTPVQFDSASDGNRFAAAVISQEDGGGSNSLLMPVVFEGDLAHVVACHVRENDRVFVSGQLSMGPMRFTFKDGLGKCHLVAENLNFVEGFVPNVAGKKSRVPFSSVVQIEKPLDKKAEEEVVEKVGNHEEFNKKWKEALENAKRSSGESDWAYSSVTKQSKDESKQERGHEKIGESAKTKKNGDSSLDLWKDLVESPHQWWDYRAHKSNGLVKDKFPDFKHKETGNSLWIDSAPDWVLPGLEKLEFDVKFMKARPAKGGQWVGEKKEFDFKITKAKEGQGGRGEDSWKSLVETPNKWWDNRLDKRNPRAPDFKHKETGEGLWVSDTPDWALSKVPVLKDGNKNMQAV